MFRESRVHGLESDAADPGKERGRDIIMKLKKKEGEVGERWRRERRSRRRSHNRPWNNQSLVID